ncbi:MAG: acyltransferase 3 [Acidimicrobiales bacterium]|nr:acyltransferase 3 [Acidimicrobiales bacterium]
MAGLYDPRIATTAPTARPPHRARSPRFPTFEGLRGLAATLIVVFHAATFAGTNTRPGWGSLVRRLDVGVSIFFVLSAFLLYRPFVESRLLDEPAPLTRSFLWRRVLRIVPAYWLALTVAGHVLHVVALGGWWAQVRLYGFGQVYWGDTVFGGLTQAWSLCTEVTFYLFLPLWAVLLRRVRGSTAARLRVEYLGCALLYVLGLAFRWQLRAGGHAIGYAWLPANLDLFALGMVLAVAYTALRGRPDGPEAMLARTLGAAPALAWLAAGCCYVAVSQLYRPIGFETPSPALEVGRQVLYGAVAFLLVAPGVFGPPRRGWIRRTLASPVVAWVGVVSYGLYLWHVTVLSKLDHWLRRPGGLASSWLTYCAGGLAVGVLVASISWFALERPILGLKRWGPGRGA